MHQKKLMLTSKNYKPKLCRMSAFSTFANNFTITSPNATVYKFFEAIKDNLGLLFLEVNN